MALLVLAILIVLVVQFTFSVRVEEQIVQNAQDDARLLYAARSAPALLEALFRDDRANGEPKGEVDTLADILFDPEAEEARTLTLDEVELTLEAEDLERRLPLVWLADEKKKAFTQAALARLIGREEVAAGVGDPAALAEELAGLVQSLQDGAGGGQAGAAPPGPTGAAEFARGLTSLDQLLATTGGDGSGEPAPAPDPGQPPAAAGGVSYALLFGDPKAEPPTSGIAPYVTLWPVDGININTVLPEVLFAIIPEKDAETADPPGPTKYWENGLDAELVEAIRKHRIDPDQQGAAADGAAGAGGAPPAGGDGGGGQGASRKWSGAAFAKVRDLADESIHEKLKKIFPPAEGDGGSPGGEGGGPGGHGGGPGGGGPPPGGGGGTPPANGQGGEQTFGLEQALTVQSKLYVVRVTARQGEDVQARYRLIVVRSAKDEVSVLQFEELAE